MANYQPDRAALAMAVGDFQAARRKAGLESLLALLSRRSTNLMSYDEVRQKIRTIQSARRTLEDVPIHKIVGSVNRYSDFSRSFLPRNPTDMQRWAFVRMGMTEQRGLPPIEVYKVGDVYFVLDGHHRISVAREMGADSIEGYVTEVYTRVPLSPGDSPDDLIIKSEYDDFLAQTRLDDTRPGANLLVTAPGQYQKMLEHIDVHKYFLSQQRHKEVPLPEAAISWYDTIYLPTAAVIRDSNLLRDFPNRTEADLYLWLMDHRAALSGGSLEWQVSPQAAAADLARRYSTKPSRELARLAKKAADLFIPAPLDPGPPPGAWRAGHQDPHRGDRLFDDLLVTVPVSGAKWPAVQIAIEVARREEARLTGLQVVASEADKDSPEVQRTRERFAQHCAEAGVASRMVVEAGAVADLICRRSVWVDLVVFSLNFPPPIRPFDRLRSGARYIIRRAAAPVFAVPDAPFHLGSALLAYGPGRKADEALFVATYLAGRWNIPLTVLTVRPRQSAGADGASTPLERARQYLDEHQVHADLIEVTGEESRDAARAIVLNAETHQADFIIMGGYESGPLREALFSSTVDRVLRSTRRPVLICR